MMHKHFLIQKFSLSNRILHQTNYKLSLHTSQQNDGPFVQPVEVNYNDINFFFLNSIAKNWAMKKGFTATLRHYKTERLELDIITDPRFDGDNWLHSQFIAGLMKDKIAVLKSASSYLAHQYKAQDIIGFNAEDSPVNSHEVFWKRIEQSYSCLNTKPDLIHAGRIYPARALPKNYGLKRLWLS